MKKNIHIFPLLKFTNQVSYKLQEIRAAKGVNLDQLEEVKSIQGEIRINNVDEFGEQTEHNIS